MSWRAARATATAVMLSAGVILAGGCGDSGSSAGAIDPTADDDGDGVSNGQEGTVDADGDGIPAYLDPDEVVVNFPDGSGVDGVTTTQTDGGGNGGNNTGGNAGGNGSADAGSDATTTSGACDPGCASNEVCFEAANTCMLAPLGRDYVEGTLSVVSPSELGTLLSTAATFAANQGADTDTKYLGMKVDAQLDDSGALVVVYGSVASDPDGADAWIMQHTEAELRGGSPPAVLKLRPDPNAEAGKENRSFVSDVTTFTISSTSDLGDSPTTITLTGREATVWVVFSEDLSSIEHVGIDSPSVAFEPGSRASGKMRSDDLEAATFDLGSLTGLACAFMCSELTFLECQADGVFENMLDALKCNGLEPDTTSGGVDAYSYEIAFDGLETSVSYPAP